MKSIQSIAQDTKMVILDKRCEEVSEQTKTRKDGKRPYGIISKILNETRHVCPWVTRHDITNRMRRKEKKAVSIYTAIVPYTTNGEMVVRGPNAVGGRPIGTTKKKRKLDAMAMVSSMNEIALQFEKEKKKAKDSGKRMKKGRIDEIIDAVKKQNNLPDKCVIKKEVIWQRIKRAKPKT